MPGRDGVEILIELRERWPGLPVVMMSGHGTVETAVRTTKHGAYDFIEKPLSIDKVLLTIQHALDQTRLQRENRALRAQALRAHEIIGESPEMTELVKQIDVAAPSNGWALITGENGTGKELVARQIHARSRRADAPFVEVNCAAIPEELIESELFGHEKGAFTGAVAQKAGKVQLSHGGTIFLDEVADMSLMTQAEGLRILHEQRFSRVGGTVARGGAALVRARLPDRAPHRAGLEHLAHGGGDRDRAREPVAQDQELRNRGGEGMSPSVASRRALPIRGLARVVSLADEG